MPNLFWHLLAKLVSRPAIADWIIKRAQRTPYDHLIIDHGRIIRVKAGYQIGVLDPTEHWYMKRWWLVRFGPLQIRIHHIINPDPGRDLHSHPWPFRTFILKGGYVEYREDGAPLVRDPGETATMNRGGFHRIEDLLPGGAWTMFATWGERQGWGFKRDDGSVTPHEEY
ncbi:hypothetical protein ACIGCM_03805 [Pseudomonas sp. NPDC078700]|uniref:hypothetical protein n=1 Tax=Pseudomonas sp. NPDC078700 TaxID=3364424 RepID=UPI0037C590B2